MRYCAACGETLRARWFSRPPGFSRSTGVLYKNYKEAAEAEGLKAFEKLMEEMGQKWMNYIDEHWLVVCDACYENRATMPDEFKVEVQVKDNLLAKSTEKVSESKKLIDCPDCGKEVSRRAASCPNCGCPIAEILLHEQEKMVDDLVCPELPEDLSIGSQIVNWSGSACVSATFNKEENVSDEIVPGDVDIRLHQHGILVHTKWQLILGLKIHFSQIIHIGYEDRDSLAKMIEKDKSVIGRAVVGALLLGPLGAIIGGVSGVGTKRIKKSDCLVISFWSETSRRPQTLLFSGENKAVQFQRFAKRVNDEIGASLVRKAEAKIEAGNRCPRCGQFDVYKATREDGGWGNYCPHCQMSLQRMQELARKG